MVISLLCYCSGYLIEPERANIKTDKEAYKPGEKHTLANKRKKKTVLMQAWVGEDMDSNEKIELFETAKVEFDEKQLGNGPRVLISHRMR